VLIAFHKPYGVLSQFTEDGSGNGTLAVFGLPKGVYALGRLDADSEGLLLLSDEAGLNEALLHPRHGHERTYWAQVERVPDEAGLQRLREGLVIQGCETRRCGARILEPQPVVAARVPPIRFRKNVPEAWIELKLIEGKNRQVRRMTAAIGHATLRLIRVAIGDLQLGDLPAGQLNGLPAGQWREVTPAERAQVFRGNLLSNNKNKTTRISRPFSYSSRGKPSGRRLPR